MKKFGLYLTVGLGALLLSTSAFAQEDEGDNDDLRFSSEDFIDEYNLFLGEDAEQDEDDAVDLKLNLKNAEEDDDDGFIYFKKGTQGDGPSSSLALTPVGNLQSDFQPRNTNFTGNMEDVAGPNGQTFSLSNFTPRYTSADISFTIGGNDEEGLEQKRGLEISLATQFYTRNLNVLGTVGNSFANEALRSQVYDLGVNVAYSNFYLGASVRGEEGAYYDGITGYDIGLSYERPTWSTSILFGEYRQNGNSLISQLNSPYLNETYMTMEIGGAYHLAPWVRFVGSFRMFEDPDLFLTEGEGAFSRMFYLGTRVNF